MLPQNSIKFFYKNHKWKMRSPNNNFTNLGQQKHSWHHSGIGKKNRELVLLVIKTVHFFAVNTDKRLVIATSSSVPIISFL